MKTNVLYKLIIFISALILSGCGVSQSQLNPETGLAYTEKEYAIILDRKEFEEKISAGATVDVDQNAKVISTMLIEPGNPIMYKVKMKGIKNVHGLQLIEKERLNLNRVLVDHTDYIWDSVNHELLIVFNVPHAYLLENEVRFKLNILIEDDTQFVGVMERFFVFWHKPMRENGESYMSFDYLPNYDDLGSVDSVMRSELKEEAAKVDMKRIDNSYKNEVVKAK